MLPAFSLPIAICTTFQSVPRSAYPPSTSSVWPMIIEAAGEAIPFDDASLDLVVSSFLLHELPHDLKGQALREAGRMLAPGGKLYLAEFHRPELWPLRALSWTYFKVFEPLGLALWDTHDPLEYLENMGGWTCERTTYLFGNFQIITATKQ